MDDPLDDAPPQAQVTSPPSLSLRGSTVGALALIGLGTFQLFLIGSPSLVWLPVASALGILVWLATLLPDDG